MTFRQEQSKFTKAQNFVRKWLSPESFHSYYTYFVTAVALGIGLTGFTGYEMYIHRNDFKDYDSARKVATRIADTNHDGTLSFDEKIKMLYEMGVSINIPGETRHPTIGELENYISRHSNSQEENRK